MMLPKFKRKLTNVRKWIWSLNCNFCFAEYYFSAMIRNNKCMQKYGNNILGDPITIRPSDDEPSLPLNLLDENSSSFPNLRCGCHYLIIPWSLHPDPHPFSCLLRMFSLPSYLLECGDLFIGYCHACVSCICVLALFWKGVYWTESLLTCVHIPSIVKC